MQIFYCCSSRISRTHLTTQPRVLNNLKFVWALTHPYSLVLLLPSNLSVSQKFFGTSRSDPTSRPPNESLSNKPLESLQTSMPSPSVRSNTFPVPITSFTYLKGQHSTRKSASNTYPLPRQHTSRKRWISCLKPEYANQLTPRTSSAYHLSR
jgi:hypothetical protein